MKRYILLTDKIWHDDLFLKLSSRQDEEWHRINDKKDFTLENLLNVNPNKIFIPHWSYIIPSSIHSRFECIVFHMTDLPFGRGGSPLQNLIIRGYNETKISALKVTDGIDTGDIYLKRKLSLIGSALSIFKRSSKIILKMIEKIIDHPVKPIKQKGEVVHFKRRAPKDGDLINVMELNAIYDLIRMLDCPGYPNAFIEINQNKFEFFNAKITKHKNEIIANVRIIKK